MRRWGALLVLVAIVAWATTGCGEEETRYADEKIVERLNLEQIDGGGYAVDGDPFCEVEPKLLNNAAEVEEVADKDELGLVIASRQGNAGVKGVPPFAPDCGDEVKKKLNRLDPVPKEE